ncbi:MAG: hypothetical protein Pg6C_19670 [Treponemataceae bacterium]|nr:MAG: hypothetical protein Pg6C_19670 [Treponemataceae bacterium]
MTFKAGRAAAVIAALVCLSGCAKKSAEQGEAFNRAYEPHRAAAFSESYDDSSPEETPAPEFAGESGRKLVTAVNMEIRLDDLEAGAAKLGALIKKYGAYASSIRVYDVFRQYSLKVPAARLKQFTDEAMTLGKILNYSETTEDVTLRYVDLESRQRTKTELLKTYQSYLAKAKNIEEILSVESRIADLQAEIDNTGSQFRALNNLIDYSAVDIELLGPVTAFPRGKPSIGERVKELFAGAGGYMSMLVVILLGLVVYGIPALFVILVLYWVLLGKIGVLKKLFRFVSGKKK